jgi:hypothetical protein
MDVRKLPFRGKITPIIANFAAASPSERSAMQEVFSPWCRSTRTDADIVVMALLSPEYLQDIGRHDLVEKALSAVYHGAEAAGEIDVAIWARSKMRQVSGGKTSQALIS